MEFQEKPKMEPVSTTAQKNYYVFGLQRIGVPSWFFVRQTNNLFLKQKWSKEIEIFLKTTACLKGQENSNSERNGF